MRPDPGAEPAHGVQQAGGRAGVTGRQRVLAALLGQQRPKVAGAASARRPGVAVARPVAVAVAVVAVPARPGGRVGPDRGVHDRQRPGHVRVVRPSVRAIRQVPGDRPPTPARAGGGYMTSKVSQTSMLPPLWTMGQLLAMPMALSMLSARTMLYPVTGLAPPPSATEPSAAIVLARATGFPPSTMAGPRSWNHLPHAAITWACASSV